MSLSNVNTQQLSEVMNVGISSAMNTLSTILSNKITTKCGDAVIRDIASSDYSLLSPALYFNIAFSGDLQGKAIAVFRKIDLSVILRFLMNSDSDEIEFDEMGLGMIKEIMSQLSGEFAKKVGDFFGLDITASISALMDFNNQQDIASSFECAENNDILNVSFQYEIGTVLKGRGIFSFNEPMIRTINDVYLESSLARGNMTEASNSEKNKPEQTNESSNSAGNSGNTIPDGVNIQPTTFPRFTTGEHGDSSILGGNMSLLMDVPLNVCVEIGKTKKRMKEIMNFTQGTVIPIDKQAGAPVDITVNGQLIARGDVIVIDDNFGVRITELVGSDLLDKN